MNLPTLLFASCALLSVCVQADEIKRVALDGTTPVAAPSQDDGKDGIARIGKIEQTALELFPCSGDRHLGTVLIFPGGGYNILAVTHEGRNVARMLNEAGWDAAVLLYHVAEGAKTREMAMDDAKGALALLQKGTTGLATAKIGVLGFSAGGHLAARLTHESTGATAPAFQVLMYPAYLDKDGTVLAEVAPTKTPTFEYVAADDKFHTGAVAYESACKQIGTRCELNLPVKGGHGFGLKANLPETVGDWPEKLKLFLSSL